MAAVVVEVAADVVVVVVVAGAQAPVTHSHRVHGGATTTGPDATHPLAICQNLRGGGLIQGPGLAAPP